MKDCYFDEQLQQCVKCESIRLSGASQHGIQKPLAATMFACARRQRNSGDQEPIRVQMGSMDDLPGHDGSGQMVISHVTLKLDI